MSVDEKAAAEKLSNYLRPKFKLLPVNGLQQQLIAVQVKLQNSYGVAKEHLTN